MSEYMALYRKWRPMTFDEIVGQEQISETLKNSVKTGRIAHAYLFCGTRGTGKTTSAKIFARAVNCEHPEDGNPCNKCPSCLGILNGSILDVYEMDAASNSGVNNIREIRDEVIYSPSECKYKVYIIDEAHMLTSEAFNALLKTLEEPPGHVIFILATTEPENIIPTVLSRCQRFDFRRIPPDIISARTEKIAKAENLSLTPDAAELIATLADGSMRDALSILEQCAATKPEGLKVSDVLEITGAVDNGSLFEAAEAVAENSAEKALKITNSILNMGKEVISFFEELIAHFRALMLCKTGGDTAALLEKTQEAAKKYELQAEKFSLDRIMFSINTLGEHLLLAKKLPSPRTAAEMAMVRLCSPEYSDNVQALAARVAALEKKLAAFGENPPAAIHGSHTDTAHTEKNVTAAEPLPAKPHTENSASWTKWTEAIKKIKEESKTLYTFLFNAEALYFGDEIELVLSNDLAFNRIATPEGKEYLAKLFSEIQGEELKVTVFKKGRANSERSSSPSIFDIAAKKDILGDKMTVVNESENK